MRRLHVSRSIDLALVLLLVVSIAGFASSTHQESSPPGADSWLQGEEPTETPTSEEPTPTQPPPTPTPGSTNTPLPERSIVVEAFADVTGPGGLQCSGCDRIFSSSDQVMNAADPLPNLDFVLREAESGRVLTRQTTTLDTQGRARTRFRVPAGFDQALTVELASEPGKYQLCPNVSKVRTIQPDDFILGVHLEQFPFWKGCEVPEPTIEPSPTPTNTLAPTPTAEPEVSPTPTPTEMPAGTLLAVVTAYGLNVRTGPGIEYARIGAVVGGTELTLTGRDEAGTWVRGKAPEAGLEGWFSAAFMDIDGDVKVLPVIVPLGEVQATPTVAATMAVTPTETVIPDKLPQTGEYDIPLWGLLAMAAAILLALSHVWRWGRRAMAD